MNNALLATGYTFKLPSYFLKHFFGGPLMFVPNVKMHASNSFEGGKVVIWKQEFWDKKNRRYWRMVLVLRQVKMLHKPCNYVHLNSYSWQEIKMNWKIYFWQSMIRIQSTIWGFNCTSVRSCSIIFVNF